MGAFFRVGFLSLNDWNHTEGNVLLYSTVNEDLRNGFFASQFMIPMVFAKVGM